MTRLGKRAKRRGGFTLIELLLVVAILAVLAFLAAPAIANTIKNSRIRTCASNEIMIEQAVWRWYADQVAAGVSQPFADANGEVGAGSWVNTLAAGATWDGTTGADADKEDVLADYFRPSKPPSCPFDGTEAYEIKVLIENGILKDVLVICGNGDGTLHTRPEDRPTAFGAGT